MDLRSLLRQTLQWEAQTAQDNRGGRTYAAPVTVRGRAVATLRDIIAKTGETTTTTVQVTMLEEPGIGDLINGREVITVAPIVDIGGHTVGYSARTR